MSVIAIEAASERLQRRWIFGAIGIAVLLHLALAGALGWYKVAHLEVPYDHSPPTGPFTVKRIEINPDALKANSEDPISKLPVVEPPRNPSQFNLDPNLVEKALQTPPPELSAPSVPEPGKVVAATELSPSLPFAESDSAKITAEISQVEPGGAATSPLVSSKTAQDLISAIPAPPQTGPPGGALATGNGADGTMPGFTQLVPAFHANPTVSNLPEPVLLRLPSDVLFDFDSAQLKPEAGPLLTQAVGLVTKYAQADVQIDGYSDSFGKPDYNLSLSQQRSQAVQNWLQNHVPPLGYKFRSQGHGSANYVVSAQGTIEQQQPNRRVEILIQALKP